MENRTFLIGEALSGARLDAALAALLPGFTRSYLQKLIEAGGVAVGGRPAAKCGLRLAAGDRVDAAIPDPVAPAAAPEDIPLKIVYEDGELLVVDKPKGMVVHPAPGHASGTLVNALLWHCRGELSGIGGVLRPGIVHRIDKDTSGLLIVAKTDAAHRALAAQIARHAFEREYRAVVYGGFSSPSGTVDAPVGRHPTDRKRMAVVDEARGGRRAVTHYEVLGAGGGFTYLRCRLETGRTHQIRVHMAHIGRPVAGDPVYGPKRAIASLGGQCLHAGHIAFTHPATGEWIALESPLPDYFTRFLKQAGIDPAGVHSTGAGPEGE